MLCCHNPQHTSYQIVSSIVRSSLCVHKLPPNYKLSASLHGAGFTIALHLRECLRWLCERTHIAWLLAPVSPYCQIFDTLYSPAVLLFGSTLNLESLQKHLRLYLCSEIIGVQNELWMKILLHLSLYCTSDRFNHWLSILLLIIRIINFFQF